MGRGGRGLRGKLPRARRRGTAEAGFPDGIAPRPEDYVFLKRRPSAFYGTGVAQLLRMLRRDTIIIGGGPNRGVETSVREAFNLNLACIVVRECCWSGDSTAHAYSPTRR
jgi:maleamate amidohydrolase